MTCPNGATSSRWAEDRCQEGAAVVRARFPTAACRPCKTREQCTRPNNKSDMGRRITFRPQAEYEVIQRARTQEETKEWKEQHAHRAGVEGTISQGVRAFGLRRCRYHGLAKARLQHQLTATAMNFHRLNAWWINTPRARTRVCHLAALRPTAQNSCS
ncbi:transposase [Streptomyces sp. NPDC048415]|uniref:transposase n=1 Tax=Streptomyces sp. NPDC048415 TaxID=3154822 RepID=UPI003415859E